MAKVFISRSHFDAHVVAYLNHSTVYADKARFPDARRANERATAAYQQSCDNTGWDN